jgi:PAS domain S-box-containing protein
LAAVFFVAGCARELPFSGGGRGPSPRSAAAVGLAAALLGAGAGAAGVFLSLRSAGRRSAAHASQMTRQLAERERLWKTLTESAPVGIFQTDVGGRLVYANPHWHALTGKTRGGGDWLEVVHADDQAAVRQSWIALAGGRPFSAQFRTTRPGDNVTWVTAFVAPTLDPAGRVSGYLGTAQDISEIKRQERDLIASSKMSSLGEMAGGIAHEINNPLMIIQAHANALKRHCDRGELDAERARAAVHQIEDTVQRIAKIITGLRAFARNADRDPLAAAPVGQIVEATLGLCQQRFRAIGVEVALAGALDAQLNCRAVQLSQVILNLLNNAYDAIERLDEKWIALDVEDRPGEVAIGVTDSGLGIPAHVAAKMMQPFFTTKPVGKGTGLGLSISKGIVEDHGGKIELDRASLNTRFVITLPKGAEAADG